VPLGFLLSVCLGARLGPAGGAAAAAVAAALLSLAMEAVQVFLPARIASSVDLLCNSVGALLGAMAAPLFAPSRILGGRLHAARHRLLVEGAVADAGMVIVLLWTLTQFHPTSQLFGTGALRASLDLPLIAIHTPALAFSTEAAVVGLNLVGVGLLLSAILNPGARPLLATAAVVALAIAIKVVTAALLVRAPTPFSWMTPGVGAGLIAGWLTLWATAALPRAGRLVLATACIVAATAVINLAPENPYQSIPPRLLARGVSHFLSFSGIARALSEIWPLLATGFLLFALAARRHRL
jgi:hypothetical protein